MRVQYNPTDNSIGPGYNRLKKLGSSLLNLALKSKNEEASGCPYLRPSKTPRSQTNLMELTTFLNAANLLVAALRWASISV